jgi:hypothetical protein
MALINDIATLKKYVKVMFTNQNSEMPDIIGAEQKYLAPILGSTIYNNLLTESANAGTPSTLLALCRAALAPLTYYEDLPVIHLSIGDRGIGTFVSDNMQAAHRWEYNELREYFAEKGCYALETLLEYLYTNANDLGWATPDDYKLIFLTGKEFHKYFRIFQPYRTFEDFRFIVKQVEDDFIKPAIGENVFFDLRDNYSQTGDVRIKNIIGLIKKATAFLTISLATEVLPIKFSTKGATTLLARADTEGKYPSDNNADFSQLLLQRDSTRKTGENYLQQLSAFLNTTASNDFFSMYFNSPFYKAISTEKPKSINESTNNFFM